MLYSPKPELIFDVSNMTVGVKNKEGKLEIYTDKMSAFNRIYWANWFGQKDSIVMKLKSNIFITQYGQKIIINKNSHCKKAEIYININERAKCRGSLITVNKDFLEQHPVILIFCNSSNCRIKSNSTNNRFK